MHSEMMSYPSLDDAFAFGLELSNSSNVWYVRRVHWHSSFPHNHAAVHSAVKHTLQSTHPSKVGAEPTVAHRTCCLYRQPDRQVTEEVAAQSID